MCIQFRASSFIKEALLYLRREIGSQSLIARDSKHSIFIKGEMIQTKKKRNSMGQMDVADIYRTC
jgi:hypothetical protein